MESDSGTVMLYDIIERSARDGLDRQRDDGSFPPGRNYTYDEPETPVRTTSHWLQILTKAYEISGDAVFKNTANDAIDYLLSDEVRPSGFTYHCRNVESKDKCNGLVGQAAPIRALTQASEVFERPDARETAEEVFRIHPFSEALGLWERVEIDGQALSFDRTLNHQIIFAAAVADLAPYVETAENYIRNFLEHLPINMRLHTNGLIKHYVRPSPVELGRSILCAPRRRFDMVINEIAFHYYSYSEMRRKKERGYHTVNLEALTKLKEKVPHHSFWETEKFSKSRQFLDSNEIELVEGTETRHGHPIPGVAVAKIRHYFDDVSKDKISELMRREMEDESSFEGSVFSINDIDENTEVALVSSLVDFPNLEIYL